MQATLSLTGLLCRKGSNFAVGEIVLKEIMSIPSPPTLYTYRCILFFLRGKRGLCVCVWGGGEFDCLLMSCCLFSLFLSCLFFFLFNCPKVGWTAFIAISCFGEKRLICIVLQPRCSNSFLTDRMKEAIVNNNGIAGKVNCSRCILWDNH